MTDTYVELRCSTAPERHDWAESGGHLNDGAYTVAGSGAVWSDDSDSSYTETDVAFYTLDGGLNWGTETPQPGALLPVMPSNFGLALSDGVKIRCEGLSGVADPPGDVFADNQWPYVQWSLWNAATEAFLASSDPVRSPEGIGPQDITVNVSGVFGDIAGPLLTGDLFLTAGIGGGAGVMRVYEVTLFGWLYDVEEPPPETAVGIPMLRKLQRGDLRRGPGRRTRYTPRRLGAVV